MNPKQQAGDQRGRLSSRIFGPNPPVMPAAGNRKFLTSVAGGLRCLARQSQVSASHANRIYAQRLACALSTRGAPSTTKTCGRGRGPAGSRPAATATVRVSHQKWPFEPKLPQEYRGQKGALGDFPLVEPPKSRVGFVNPPLCCCQRHFPFGPHVGTAGLFSTIAIRSRPALRWEPAGCCAQAHAPSA